MRSPNTHLEFDLDLAKEASEKNPVFYLQYAHARMCSVFRKGGVDPVSLDPTDEELKALGPGAERQVLMAVLRFPERVRAAAAARAPYQVCHYLEELDPDRRLLADGPSRPARLALARAVQLTLGSGLRLLGISAPERLEREEE